MALDTTRIIIAAVKSTCWKDKPNNKNSEVIEIGVCLFNVAAGKIEHRVETLVQPKHSRIDGYCARRTGISHHDAIGKGMPFEEMCTFINKEFDTKKYAWASYGDFARVLIQRQCSKLHVWFPFGKTYMNVKYLFALKHRLNEQVGFYKAFEIINFKHEEVQSALNEATGTALMLHSILDDSY